MTVTIRTAVPADAYALQLRPSDLHEGALWVPGMGASEAVHSSIEYATKAVAAVEDGEVIAVAGYTVEGCEVYPWLMCSTRVRSHSRLLMRAARGLLREVRERFPQHLVCNYVHRPNLEARAFITALGFRVLPTPGRPEFDFFYLPSCVSHS